MKARHSQAIGRQLVQRNSVGDHEAAVILLGETEDPELNSMATHEAAEADSTSSRPLSLSAFMSGFTGISPSSPRYVSLTRLGCHGSRVWGKRY